MTLKVINMEMSSSQRAVSDFEAYKKQIFISDATDHPTASQQLLLAKR
jgi:hypothetical protein